MASQHTEEQIVYEATNQEGKRERVFLAEGRLEIIDDAKAGNPSEGEKRDDRRNSEDTDTLNSGNK